MGSPRRLPALLAVALLAAAACAQDCASPLNGHLLLAEEGAIWKVDANGQNREVLVSTSVPISLDYSHKRNTLYWSDLETRKIYALKDKASKPKVFVPRQKSWLPVSIALDSVSDKIYVVDGFSGTLQVFDLNSEAHGVVIGNNLTTPKDVTLDPYEGYLFTLDKYQIRRADMDGRNAEVIYSEYENMNNIFERVTEGLKNIFSKALLSKEDFAKTYKKELSIADITVDPKTKRVYWVNTKTRSVESSDYYGNNRKVHFQDNEGSGAFESFASLTILDGSLYWADDETQQVFKIDVNDGSKNSVIVDDMRPQFIRAVSCPNQRPVSNPCATVKCQHLCVLSRSSQDNYRCICNIGYEVADDGSSCVAIKDFLLFTQNEHVRGLSLSGNDKPSVNAIDPTKFAIGSASILDYNAEERIIYYNSRFPNSQIHQIRIDSGEEQILQPDLLSKDVYHFAYDWASKNFYYFTYYYADVTTLSVFNIENPTYSKILVPNVQRLVRGIVLHPNRGYVYYAQYINDQHSSISRMSMDGSDRNVLIDLGNVFVDGLAIDYEEDRLYWSESLNEKDGARIRHSNLDGTDIQDLPLSKSLERVSWIAVKGDWVYVIAGSEKTLVRLNKHNSEQTVLVDVEERGELSSLKVYSPEIQVTKANHPCASAHGCEKFCFAVPTANGGLVAKCGCPYGEKLEKDGKSCIDNRQEEPPFVPCKFTSMKCNMKTEAV